MPTVGDFLRAAALFETAAADARRLVTPVQRAMGPDVLTGGRLTSSTYAQISARTIEAHALSGELFGLATESRARAAATMIAADEAGAYADAMADYAVTRRGYDRRQADYRTDPLLPHPGRAPIPPTAPSLPPSWADF